MYTDLTKVFSKSHEKSLRKLVRIYLQQPRYREPDVLVQLGWGNLCKDRQPVAIVLALETLAGKRYVDS